MNFPPTTEPTTDTEPHHWETRVIKIDPEGPLHNRDFDYPVQLIRNGEVVVFPTETVYGLGANALDPHAVSKIFITKKRPPDNPLIVHISNQEMLKLLVKDIPEKAFLLMKNFWPGPLTILFEKSSAVPDAVVCGQPKVAIRMPSHPIAQKLISLSNLPIAAPSANISGRPSPTCTSHVLADLRGRCPCIIDGGDCNEGLESTVVDVSLELILRPGGVTLEQLREYIPKIEVYSKSGYHIDLTEKPPTPGLKYRHYSPVAPVILLEGTDTKKMESKIAQIWSDCKMNSQKLGLIHTHPHSIALPEGAKEDSHFFLVTLGDEGNPKAVAKGLFGALRDLDVEGVVTIVMEGISESNEGLAVMNRIRKAAKEIIFVDKN